MLSRKYPARYVSDRTSPKASDWIAKAPVGSRAVIPWFYWFQKNEKRMREVYAINWGKWISISPACEQHKTFPGVIDVLV